MGTETEKLEGGVGGVGDEEFGCVDEDLGDCFDEVVFCSSLRFFVRVAGAEGFVEDAGAEKGGNGGDVGDGLVEIEEDEGEV